MFHSTIKLLKSRALPSYSYRHSTLTPSHQLSHQSTLHPILHNQPLYNDTPINTISHPLNGHMIHYHNRSVNPLLTTTVTTPQSCIYIYIFWVYHDMYGPTTSYKVPILCAAYFRVTVITNQQIGYTAHHKAT